MYSILPSLSTPHTPPPILFWSHLSRVLKDLLLRRINFQCLPRKTFSFCFISLTTFEDEKIILILGPGLISGKDDPNIWFGSIRNKNFLPTLQTWTNSTSPSHRTLAKDWYQIRIEIFWGVLKKFGWFKSVLQLFSSKQSHFYPIIKTRWLIWDSFSEPKRPSHDN